jgi:hypothetical protein
MGKESYQGSERNFCTMRGFKAFAAVQLRSPFFWDLALLRLVIGVRRFETAYWAKCPFCMDIVTIQDENTLYRNVGHLSSSDAAPRPVSMETSACLPGCSKEVEMGHQNSDGLQSKLRDCSFEAIDRRENVFVKPSKTYQFLLSEMRDCKYVFTASRSISETRFLYRVFPHKVCQTLVCYNIRHFE